MAERRHRSLKTDLTRFYDRLTADSLRRNSTILVVSQAVNAGVAFLFWIICARLFSAHDVGLAASFISYGVLVATFTNLGLPNTILRFLPTSSRRGRLFTGALTLVVCASIAGATLALLLVGRVVPRLEFVAGSPLLATLLFMLVAGIAVSAYLDGTLMAFRKGQYILGKAIIISLPRLLLPFLLLPLATAGILITYVVVFCFGIAYNVYVVIVRLLPGESLAPSMSEVLRHRAFAAGNYLGGVFGVLPSTLVPLIVLSKLGAVAAAYFYMPMQIAAFLSIIAASTSQAMISETSQQSDGRYDVAHFQNAIRHLYGMLVPAIGLAIVLGWPVLYIYGPLYARHGYACLVILSVASLLVALNWLGDAWLNVKRRVLAYFAMNAVNAVCVVGCVLLSAGHGLTTAAAGWLVGQAISAVIYVSVFARSHLFARTSRVGSG